jgi:RNA polymerase sigma factor (TIGR02999 family)
MFGSPKRSNSAELTILLNRMQHGDGEAAEQAVSLIYEELHHIASREMGRERVGHTLQTTALIHEAYLRLVGNDSLEIRNREHFFAIASRQMRRILVDHARSSGAQMRGGGAVHVNLDGIVLAGKNSDTEVLLLDETLKDLEHLDPRAAKIVELRYFGGYTDKEVADALGISVASIRRDWEFARSWLYDRMNRRNPQPDTRPNVTGNASKGS